MGRRCVGVCSVWLRGKIHAGEWYYKVVGSCEVQFSTSLQPDKNLYVCVCVCVCGDSDK